MMCRSRWAAQRICVVLVALALWSATPLAQQVFTGKVVGITDGDTISVMRAGLAVRVRLEGIDCPENAQDFSNRAKQFTSAKAFGKTVTIEPRDTDRYGRTVARVVVDGEDLGLALVKAGLAWHYKQYSSDAGVGRELRRRHEKHELVCGVTRSQFLRGSIDARPLLQPPQGRFTEMCGVACSIALGVRTTSAKTALRSSRRGSWRWQQGFGRRVIA